MTECSDTLAVSIRPGQDRCDILVIDRHEDVLEAALQELIDSACDETGRANAVIEVHFICVMHMHFFLPWCAIDTCMNGSSIPR